MSLHAISPVDGRYHDKVQELSPCFSEYALIRERCKVEVEYLIALASIGLKQMPALDTPTASALRDICQAFGEHEAARVKAFEKSTNHDVKAVEYFLKEILRHKERPELCEWVHFGLTSQDINNTAIPVLTKRAVESVMIPTLDVVIRALGVLSKEWNDAPMLARTHGQPASPTTMGKEIRVFIERLDIQRTTLLNIKYYGKFGGASGNFNAHRAAYPEIDWPAFADTLVSGLGLNREQTTTQIDHYDHLAALFHVWCRLNTILIDLCRDVWTYISLDYIRQKPVEGEVGSSTMPHKVNPIDFENAEGNFGVANALFGHLAEKLPVSRLQRDLTDSTVLRNIGVPFAHTLIALKALTKGLGKLSLNRTRVSADLDSHWVVLAEAIQTILRREGVAEPYELLKGLTRGSAEITRDTLWEFIDTLSVRDEVKEELKALSPHTYTGYAG
jgi:adenylosuccinate lyase